MELELAVEREQEVWLEQTHEVHREMESQMQSHWTEVERWRSQVEGECTRLEVQCATHAREERRLATRLTEVRTYCTGMRGRLESEAWAWHERAGDFETMVDAVTREHAGELEACEHLLAERRVYEEERSQLGDDLDEARYSLDRARAGLAKSLPVVRQLEGARRRALARRPSGQRLAQLRWENVELREEVQQAKQEGLEKDARYADLEDQARFRSQQRFGCFHRRVRTPSQQVSGSGATSAEQPPSTHRRQWSGGQSSTSGRQPTVVHPSQEDAVPSNRVNRVDRTGRR